MATATLEQIASDAGANNRYRELIRDDEGGKKLDPGYAGEVFTSLNRSVGQIERDRALFRQRQQKRAAIDSIPTLQERLPGIEAAITKADEELQAAKVQAAKLIADAAAKREAAGLARSKIVGTINAKDSSERWLHETAAAELHDELLRLGLKENELLYGDDKAGAKAAIEAQKQIRAKMLEPKNFRLS